MALFAKSTSNTELNSFEAGKKIADEFADLNPPPSTIILYVTQAHKINDVTKAIEQTLDQKVTIVGCTVQGFFEKNNYRENGVAAGAFALAGNISSAASFVENIKAPYQQGHQAASEILENLGTTPKLIILLFSVEVTAQVDKFLAGLGSKINCPIVGAGAGFELGATGYNTYNFVNQQISCLGISLLALAGPFETSIAAASLTISTALEFEVTKSEGPNLYELDGEPAQEVLSQYIGQDFNEVTKQITAVEIVDQAGRFGPASRPLILLEEIDPGGYKLSTNIPIGTTVELSISNENSNFESVLGIGRALKTHLSNKKIIGILCFECGGRSHYLGKNNAIIESSKLREILGEHIPWLSILGWGEIIPAVNDPALIYNFTYPIVALVESDG